MVESAEIALAEETNVQQSKEEDWEEGCFKENYMVPHVCPVATGGWCKSYVKCKNMSEYTEDKNMKKLFVSVPMKGRTEKEIRASIEKMKKIAEVYEGEELELIDSYIEDNPPKDNNQAIWYLGKSLEKLATADVFICIDDAWEWNGCYVEREVAGRYGIKGYCVKAEYVIENYAKLMNDRSRTICCTAEPVGESNV